MTTATIDEVSGTEYAQSLSAALNRALLPHRIVAKVGMRQQDGLLYVALEPLLQEGESTISMTAIERHPNAAALLPFLQQTLVDVRSQLSLDWVKLTKVSGRLPGYAFPLWQEDLLIDSPQPPGDVSVSIGGNLSGQLIIGDNNQAYNYTYNVEHGGVLNVAAPPTIRPWPTPISVKPRPFKQLLDRQSVLPVLRSTLEQVLPVEVFAAPGFGKTVLMRHLAHDEQVTSGFADGVVYLSVQQQQAEDVLQSIYDTFYEANPPFKPSYGQLQQSLQSKQALVILNELTLPKEALDHLLDAMPNCGFVLVSQERVYWQDGAAIALEGLPFPESVALLQKEIGRALSEPEQAAAKSLWTALKGNPLQLRRSAAQVKIEALANNAAGQKAEEKKVALLSLAQSAQAAETVPQKAVAQRCLDQLSNPQRAVLGLMGAMAGVALTTEQAQAITQTPETATALSELADLHLVEAIGDHYQICDDLVGIAQQSISPDPWLTRATEYFTTQFTTPSANIAEPSSTEAMLHLMDWTQKTQQWQRSIELAKQLDQPLSTSGQWAQWERVLNQCLRAAEQSGNGHAEAWSLHQLGTRSLALGEATAADDWLARSLWLREQLGDTAGAAITRHNLGFITPPLVLAEGTPVATSLVERTAQVAEPGLSRFIPWGAAVGGLALAGAAGLALMPTREEPTTALPEVEDTIAPIESELPAATSVTNLTFSPASLTFGETALKQTKRQQLAINNDGDAPVTIDTIELLGRQSSSFTLLDQSCGSKTLLPKAGCQVSVVFTPESAGDYAAQLRVALQTDEDSLLDLTGSGKATLSPTVTPTSPATPAPEVVQPEKPEGETEDPNELLANDDVDSVESGSSVVIDVLANDVASEAGAAAGPVTIVDVGEPEVGTAVAADGGIVYSHSGEGVRDRFTYTIEDANGNTSMAIVAIAVTEPTPPTEPEPPVESEPPVEPETPVESEPPVEIIEPVEQQQPPIVTNYNVEVQVGDPPTDINLLANATDPNPNDVLRVLRVANNPQKGGELVDNGDGTVTYIPAAQVPPPESEDEYVAAYNNSFEFEITDDQGGIAVGTLYIRVIIPPPQ